MIEIKGFLETSFLEWPGRLCAVLFLGNCNLRCPYCHNHALVLHPEEHLPISLQHVLDRLAALRNWIDGVCITGGEPTLHHDLASLIRTVRAHGFPVKLDTNGSNPTMLEELIEAGLIDAVSMDVKAPLDVFSYRRSAGPTVDLNSILRSIEFLKKDTIEYQFRMTVVPELHSVADVQLLGRQLRAGRNIVLQNFNPENPLDPSLKGTRPYDPDLLRAMERDIQTLM